MDITARIKRSVANRSDDVFLREEFDRFGSQAQVGRALLQMQREGAMVRLGKGIYAKAKPSVLSGKPIPAQPLEVLAPLALEKLGIRVGPSRLVRAYNEGRSTQIPAGVVFDIAKQRVTRKIGFNGKFVQYERA